MFKDFAGSLRSLIESLRGKGKLSQADIDDFLKRVKLLLLEADVSFDVVRNFVKDLREKIESSGIDKSVAPVDRLTKLVFDEIIRILGEPGRLRLSGPDVIKIMLVGLQGSGKTTTAAKLAWLIKNRYRRAPLLVAADRYRPAAVKQLKILADQIGAGFYSMLRDDGGIDYEGFLEFLRRTLYDVAIIDTAGRMHVDDELMNELREMYDNLRPDYVMLVADSMLGQEAAEIAKAFAEAVPLSGVILTKVDGDTRGGAAFSIREVAGIPIYFVGTGEKVKDIDEFDPQDIAAKILDLGSPKAFLRKISEIEKKLTQQSKKPKKLEDFNLEDFLSQLEMLDEDGLTSILTALPGGQSLMDSGGLEVAKKRLKVYRAIIQSMTPEERRNPSILNASRKRRIARGSGTRVQDVNRLLKEYKAMRKMLKTTSKFMRRGRFPFNLPRFP